MIEKQEYFKLFFNLIIHQKKHLILTVKAQVFVNQEFVKLKLIFKFTNFEHKKS